MTFARSQTMFAQLENGDGYGKISNTEVLNPYVNFHHHSNTQSLIKSLVSESVQMRGVEMFYIRREFVNFDKIFGEDMQSKFKKAYRVAMYLESYEEYSGQREFFSKFGMSANDEVSLTVSTELFTKQCDGERAKEGDLVFFPHNNGLFEITWVEPISPMVDQKSLAKYKITAQKFIYSGEEIKPEFDPSKLIAGNNDLLMPIHKLDGRSDINIIEFEEDDAFDDESDFITEFDNIIGNGSPIVVHNKPPVNDGIFDDLQSF